MLNEQTLGTLNALKLFGMAKSFNDKLAHPQLPISATRSSSPSSSRLKPTAKISA